MLPAFLMLVGCPLLSAQCGDRKPLPELIQEFFLNDAARSQERGEWQFGLGAEAWRSGGGSESSFGVEYGISDRLQVDAQLPYTFSVGTETESSHGWTNVQLGSEYQFIRSDCPFALTLGIAADLPVSSSASWVYEPTLLLAKRVGRGQLHASINPSVEQGKTEWSFNVAGVVPIQRFFPTFEMNGRRRDARTAFYLTPGIYYHLRHRLEVGVGLPLGVSGMPVRPDWSVESPGKLEERITIEAPLLGNIIQICS